MGCKGEAGREIHEELLPVQAVGAHSKHLLLDLGQLLILKVSTWIDELVLEYGRPRTSWNPLHLTMATV